MTWTFFADRDIEAREFTTIVRASGVHLEVHSSHFIDYEDDSVWLPEVTRRGWVVLSGDRRIKSRPQNVEAVMTSGATVFTLLRKGTRNHLIAQNFLNSLPQIEALLGAQQPPYIASVGRPNPPEEEILKGTPGPVKVILTLAQWRAGEERKRLRRDEGWGD